MRITTALSAKMLFVFASAAIVVLSSIDVDAQRSRRKRTASTKATVAQTPPSTTTEPVVISRAEDYATGDQIISPVLENAIKLADAQDPTDNERKIAELAARIKSLESAKKDDYDEKQKRLAMNLDILMKSEQRAEGLRKQSFDLMEKESSIKTRLETIENDLRPEAIERSIAFVGSLRPEELRATRKKNLEAERSNLQNVLSEIQRNRSNVEMSVQKADALVEKLRTKIEAEIDAALESKPSDKP